MLLCSDRGRCEYNLERYMGLYSVATTTAVSAPLTTISCAADRSAVNAHAMGLANENLATPAGVVTASTAMSTATIPITPIAHPAPAWVSATVAGVSTPPVVSANCATKCRGGSRRYACVVRCLALTRRKLRRMQRSDHPLLHL